MATTILNAVLKRWGATSTKQRIWDAEYQSGKWQHLDPQDRAEVPRDLIYQPLDRYTEGASILDLGCGTASTAAELKADYASYLGVDISEIAIVQAREILGKDPGRKRKTSFAVSDICNFVPGGQFNVILFRECLYYFPKQELRALLEHYCQFLVPGGVFVARLHDRKKYDPLVRLIERDYDVAERLAPERASEIVLVFRPRAIAVEQEQS
jgi:SAM-dependent methyltransferase